MAFETPILLLTFTRLGTTIKVFERIKEQKPKYLFWASDGPRDGRPDDVMQINLIKDYIKNEIDWDCEIKTLFREKNLGCGLAVSGAITWFFDNVERGIILEDDCVADGSFFKFCEELLERYEADERIMHISGSNFQLSEVSDHSYYFSYACQIWGWATWRRAWIKYDFDMNQYETNWDFNGFLSDKFEKKYWKNQFENVKNRKIDTWDYQWLFACWKNNGLSIMPQLNLVKNIGFGVAGTHTNSSHFIEDLKIYPLTVTIHPHEVTRNIKADKWHADILSFRDLGPTSRMIRWMDGVKAKLKNVER